MSDDALVRMRLNHADVVRRKRATHARLAVANERIRELESGLAKARLALQKARPIPDDALMLASNHLAMALGECVPLEDYADSASVLFEALANHGWVLLPLAVDAPAGRAEE